MYEKLQSDIDALKVQVAQIQAATDEAAAILAGIELPSDPKPVRVARW
jgi:hypothetical protein